MGEVVSSGVHCLIGVHPVAIRDENNRTNPPSIDSAFSRSGRSTLSSRKIVPEPIAELEEFATFRAAVRFPDSKQENLPYPVGA
jgi:hypothetical protein